MRACFFQGADKNEKFIVREIEMPSLGPHDVLVKNKACGVCGTDVHICYGGEGSAKVSPPVILGHEYSGIVVKIGDAVTNVSVGDHVSIDPNMYCGVCPACRMGRKQMCSNLFALGVNTNGGMAEYSVCPQTQCYKVDPSIPFDEAAMAEPLACAIHGIDRAQIQAGQSVLIIGCGTIGLMMVQLARLQGASSIIVSEPVQIRRDLAQSMGADAAIDPVNEDFEARLRELTDSEGTDVVIECIGKESTTKLAISSAKKGGTILLFGVPDVDATIPLPLFDIYRRELNIVGSMINPDTHQRAVNLINNKRLNLAPLITHRYGLENVEEAIKMQTSMESVKVLVVPQECDELKGLNRGEQTGK